MKAIRKWWTIALSLMLIALPTCQALGSEAGGVLRGWSAAEGYQYATFGVYEQSSGDPDPILWRVLSVDSGKALLLSEFILDTRPMGDESKKEREAREQAEADAAIADGKEPPAKAKDVYVPWEQSDMRDWLNSTFLKKAFTKAERATMPKGGKLGQVFLPSRDEIGNPEYGFDANQGVDDPARIAYGTRLAKDHNLDYRHPADPYYTRSKDSKTTYIQVRSTGGIGSARYDRDNVGVRPAIYLAVDLLVVVAGSGTSSDPYVLSPLGR